MGNKNLWIDQENAASLLIEKKLQPHVMKALASLINDGVCVVPEVNDRKLCAKVIEDYHSYCVQNLSYVNANLDDTGREKRLVNFHLWSDAAMRIGTNSIIMDILDAFFETRTSVYSSLTFKYGTQQPVHRDTPHFSTTPKNRFAGVWTALEDIDPSAGPIFYHPGAHKFVLNPTEYLEEAKRRLPNDSVKAQADMALDLYNGDVIRTAPKISEAKTLVVKAGDTVIWHPEMPHGGSPATNSQRSRWSIVFHNAPESVQVYHHDDFFGNKRQTNPRYAFNDNCGRKIALSGRTAFM
jgi:ectoine hydroxylase-related dioxygenase (phytanoyl-CoA dioxygenase family)